MATKGYAAPEVEHDLHPGPGAVSAGGGDAAALSGAVWDVAFYLVRAELQTAHELGEQLLTLAQRHKTRVSPGSPPCARDRPCSTWASLPLPATHLEQGIALYDPQQHRPALRHGEAPGVALPSLCGLDPVVLGYPDQALQRSQEALTLAQELAHPFSLAYGLCTCSLLCISCRREAQAVAGAGRGRHWPLATEQGFPL